MIHHQDRTLRISGHQLPWTADYETEQAYGPAGLCLGDKPLFGALCCRIDDLDEALALAVPARGSHKGQTAVVSTSGRLPFGAGVSFQHTHRFSDHAVRVVTDVLIPAGSRVREQVEVDTVKLPGSYTQWRVLTADGLSDWQTLGDEPMVWSTHPLALVLARRDGAQLEIGLGFDLWRWQAGVVGSDNVGQFALIRQPEGIVFRRAVSVVGREIEPEPRSYRFGSYLAWSLQPAAARPLVTSSLTWSAGGELELAAPGAAPAVLVAVGEMPMPTSLCRSGSALPCFTGNGLQKRLKKALRRLPAQLAASTAIVFSGLTPGCCDVGRHVDHHARRPHWDLTGILELATWIRQYFGGQRELVNQASLPLPSLIELFRVPDHEAPEIEYEYEPED